MKYWTYYVYTTVIASDQIAIIAITVYIETFVTGFWKTDQNLIVTLGLIHFIGPANGYTRTLHIYTVPLLGLVDWSAFLKPVLLTCKFTTGTMGRMDGAIWKAWVWNSSQWWGDFS